MTNRQILTALLPCSDGLARAAESPTMREWWETSTSRSDMMWLIGRAHSRGTLTRRALVLVAVRCCETVAHMMPAAALPHLATISSWASGAADVTARDLVEARDALWKIRQTAAANANADADYAAYAAAYAAADAYAYAADAAACVADADVDVDAACALCDVIRDAITIDEVCAALGLDPDQGV